MLRLSHDRIKLKTQFIDIALAHAYYNIGDFIKSEEILIQIETLNLSKTQQFCTLKELISARKQEKTGVYNLKTLIQQAKQDYFIQINPYFSDKIKLFFSNEKGRGLLATQYIPIGTLLIAEKAYLIGNPEQIQDQMELKYQISPLQLMQFALLAGENLQKKLDYNSFCAVLSLENEFEYEQMAYSSIFLTPSLVNHSCYPNIGWFLVGDCIFFVTCREIEQNEEIYCSYVCMDNATLSFQQEQIQKQFNFTCQCPACRNLTQEEKMAVDRMRLAAREIAIRNQQNQGQNYPELIEDEKKIELYCVDLRNILRDKRVPEHFCSEIYMVAACVERYRAVLLKKTVKINSKSSKMINHELDKAGTNSKQVVECFGVRNQEGRIRVDKDTFVVWQHISITLSLAHTMLKCKGNEKEAQQWVACAEQLVRMITGQNVRLLDVMPLLCEKFEKMGLKFQ